ncbi:MAG TPA: Asp-tRNA(Asn)/Glu-tRNA(Gln) amidotransferase GatCAB subunit B [Anaerolineaceae bacterium]|nr:Asp-tRNA(Asn)/Glu-tRNA(Gln) amidotransferase GatCAB subunit B [Anaerolineaceae bacterium]
MTEYETVIGLETHIQLNTTTKIFCGCKADSWEESPNTNICPVCTGLPGVLPVLNAAAVEKGALLAAAMHSEIRLTSFFDRKNYFYPDLPKGYQISQFDLSLGKGGHMDLPMPDGSARKVSIAKLHLEEDAGKTKYEGGRRYVDFNRCGVPLVEMVTGPDLRAADEAAQYLIRLRQLLRWLGISEANMEKGHLRCDANVSIRPVGSTTLNTKTEIKNVNSIEAVRAAINKEVERQIEVVESGGRIEAWTLDWDDAKGKLTMMRSKETEADYRYFREPDLLPLELTEEWREEVLASLPELPLERRARFIKEYDLPEYDADILTNDKPISEYFEAAVKAYGGDPKVVSNWIMNESLRMMNDLGLDADGLVVRPEHLAAVIKLVEAGTINTATGKSLLAKVQETGKAPAEIVAEEGLAQVSDDSALQQVIDKLLADNPDEVASYRGGKEGLFGWFMGQMMRETKGKADPKLSRELLQKALKGEN